MDTSDEEDEPEWEVQDKLTFRDYEDAEDWQEILLHIAAQFGEIAAMERLVAGGADINGRTDILHEWFADDWTPLMVAAISKHGATAETIRWLLEHGADPHLTSGAGQTAAWYAAGKYSLYSPEPCENLPDNAERLRLLLDAGCDPNEVGQELWSLLTRACAVGDPARVRLLLERGASPHPTGGQLDHPYRLPLVCAAKSGSAECVRLLLDAGANVHERTLLDNDFPENTVLEFAATAEIVRILVAAGADVNARCGNWDVLDESLNFASRDSRYFEAAEALVEAGADLHERKAPWGLSRLHTAAYLHEPTVVQWLLSKGVVHDGSNSGSTPLHTACRSEIEAFPQGDYTISPEILEQYPQFRCERLIRILVAAGVPTDLPDKTGSTPLHHTVLKEKGNPFALRTLLELGTQPDLLNVNGQTPLHFAAYWCSNVECFRLLLDAGADPIRLDIGGARPLDHYVERDREGRGNAEIKALLMEAEQVASNAHTC